MSIFSVFSLLGGLAFFIFGMNQMSKSLERIAGKSHYPLSKMISLALNGITSLSVKPLRLITGFGVVVALVSFIGVIWAIISALLGRTVAGWASTTCIVCFVSGVQLISLGIIGEYIGKIFLETKHRPRYIVSERTEEMDGAAETPSRDA